MIVGVPKEIKSNENRVSLVPAGAQALAGRGHSVIIQQGAGLGSGFSDDMYRSAGAEVVADVDEIWTRSEMIMKVKEPIEIEYSRMRDGQIIFTYFHFAADEKLTHAVLDSRCVAVAYETVQIPTGELPLLTPMSEVAGRMAVQEGARYLEKAHGGLGCLLGGVPGVLPAEVVILGGGVVGTNAAKIAAGFGAHVTILDINLDRLRYLSDVMPANVDTYYSNRHNILEQIARADLLIGAVLVPGAKAPSLVLRDDHGQADYAFRPDLCSGRCDPLLRCEHAGCGAANLDACFDECDIPLCHGTGESWLDRSLSDGRLVGAGAQRGRWSADIPGGWRGVWPSQPSAG